MSEDSEITPLMQSDSPSGMAKSKAPNRVVEAPKTRRFCYLEAKSCALLTLFFLASIFVGFYLTSSSEDSYDYPIVNKTLPVPPTVVALSWDEAEKKAKAALELMSFKEKISFVSGAGWEKGRCVGSTVEIINSNISIPSICLQDGPLGVRLTKGNTAFPSSMNLAATFNRTLMREYGIALGEEFRDKGAHVWLGPMMNYLRAPAAGRNWEGQGGDPYLTSISVVEQVIGAQERGVIATAKHYIANEQEINRMDISSNIDERTYREIYLKPFKAAVDAGVGAVMCSYNRINGTHACENEPALNILKNDLGFRGFVMTDWWAARDVVETANAGTDLIMPGDKYVIPSYYGGFFWGTRLESAINSGKVTEARLDDMVTRILAAFYKLRQNDTDFPITNLHSFDKKKDERLNVQRDHAKVALQVAIESTVLLKNENQLWPLKSDKVKKIAILGSDAGYGKGPNYFPNRAGIDGTLAMGWGSGTCEFPYIITPEDGIKSEAAANNISVTVSTSDTDLDLAARLAKEADVAVVFVQADSGEGHMVVNGNAGDRNDLALWNNGDDLIKAVAAVNKNVIVVIHSVGPVNMPWLSSVSTVFLALLPGQETGSAIGKILFGDAVPSGRLPFTINEKREDYCCDVFYDPNTVAIEYSEGLLIDYMWNEAKNVEPLFWFGHGLGGSTPGQVEYVSLDVNVNQNNFLTISVRLRNSDSKSSATEVVQVYLGPGGVLDQGEPKKRLKGFEKVVIQPGGIPQDVSFSVSVTEELSFWDVPSQSWKLRTGEWVAYVGSNAGDEKLKKTFNI